MGVRRFSLQAEDDLLSIAAYISDLEECCQMLADSAQSGPACDYIRPGLRRMELGKHAVFYREATGGILVSRILHQRVLP